MLKKSDLLRISRKSDSHKGDYGRILIVGGSLQFIGAPVLAALGALRAGADIVNIVAPEVAAITMNSFSPDLITTKLKGDFLSAGHFNKIAKMAHDYDVVLIGNGLKDIDVSKLVYKMDIPIVLDAGALQYVDIKKIDNCLLTPHGTEFKLLLKHSKIEKAQLQKHLGGNVILLKGNLDKIISATKISYNNTGNPGMTVGGTGDVLAGVAAALIAQSHSIFKSACTAAYVTGKAGNICYNKFGYGLTASDLVKEIPEVMKKLEVKQQPRPKNKKSVFEHRLFK